MDKFELNAKVPSGPITEKWKKYCETSKPINPANKRKYNIIVVGTGLAGASASASLGELGFNVSSFCFQDSPRRAHSIAAQGGINAAKNYKNDGDNVWRLFCDTIKGGDFRAREANVYRLAELSVKIIDHCVAQGVPFAREYGGLLDNRSFGGSLVSRTFYARGQTGQQLLLGAYSSLNRQIQKGTVKSYARMEFQDLIMIDGQAKGVIVRDLVSGEFKVFTADAVVLATGGYSSVFFLSTNAVGCNVSATYRAYKKGAYFANPCYTQIHPTCIPQSGSHQSKLTLMSESLRNDGRVWVPKVRGDSRSPINIIDEERDYYLERKYPSYGNLAPRDIASRAAKQVCDDERGVGPGGRGVYLDFADSIKRLGQDVISARYGNLFEMYEKITGDNPYRTPMRMYPAMHYSMGGLWVNYELMSNIPGLFVIGEANFSDHGANRLGASALMQTLADGYFVLPNTIASYLNTVKPGTLKNDDACIQPMVAEARESVDRLLAVKGDQSPHVLHSQLGRIMWEYCGMSRNEAGLKKALSEIKTLRSDFWKKVSVPTYSTAYNPTLEHAVRVADFMEFAELLCLDALERKESCGGHFREEFQTDDGEAQRDDDNFCHVSVWKYKGLDKKPVRNQEELKFENVPLATRSYK